MFCPTCRCEYRPGFETCADCNVPLVDDLASAPPPSQEPAPRARPSGPLLDYCGYFTLDEARGARDLLRGERIVAEIAIREAPDSPDDGPIREEYWIRFAASDLRAAQALLGFDEATGEHAADGGSRTCPECGAELAAAESFCGRCGARPGEHR